MGRFDPSMAKFVIGEMVDNAADDHEGGTVIATFMFPTVDSNCGTPVGVSDPMIVALRNQIASIEDRADTNRESPYGLMALRKPRHITSYSSAWL